MYHIGHGADAIEGIKAVQCLGDVGHTNGHHVTGTDAHGDESPGCPFDFLYEGSVTGLDTVKLIGRRLGMLLGHLLHHLEHGQFRVDEVIRMRLRHKNSFRLLFRMK